MGDWLLLFTWFLQAPESMSFLLWALQASTGMSSLRGLVGKGMGSIAVEAVLKGFCFIIPPPIDYS
jgi:hypothetical protein